MNRRLLITPVWILVVLHTSAAATAADFFLTIGGGYSPAGNQASLEKNMLFQQRFLQEQKLTASPNYVFFADGAGNAPDLQVMDKDTLPKANRLMAEFFGSQRNLGLSYRNHEVPNVRGATTPESIRRGFKDIGSTMKTGDRLVLYVTSHGNSSNDRRSPYNTTISLWDNKRISVSEVVGMLDALPNGVGVVAIMVQCHAGGFARFVYNDGDAKKGLSAQRRCGFFATVHDRQAAGCTPEVNEASYVEYSTYFWEALGGRSRTGQKIERPDYDGNGNVSLDEAHAYTILSANTIDLPIKTSGEFLGIESLFANNRHPDLLPDDFEYPALLKLATPSETAILEGLSTQLNLTGDDRIHDARQKTQQLSRSSRGSRGGNRRPTDPSYSLKQRIAADLKRRWPGLANVLNPIAIELLTTHSQEFITAIESHREYQRYRKLAGEFSTRVEPEKQKVKFERFVRTAENVILRENLRLLDNKELLAEYEAIVAAENGSLTN